MEKIEKENIDYFNASIASKLTDHQKKIISQYKTKTKLLGVMRWRERMVRHGITNVDIAKDVNVANTRISEYVNFKKQPSERKYLAIESAIYKRGA